MLNCNKLIPLFLFLSVNIVLFAQNNTNSPYTHYGYGKLADQASGQGLSMGGTGYALRTYGQINPMNPASYTMVDSLTFLMEFGLRAENARLSADTISSRGNYNGGFSYMAIQFRLKRGLGISLGIKPYSYVGYDYGSTYSLGESSYKASYSGSGSLTQLYAGVGYEILKKRLALGANFRYTFGSISRNTNLTFPESATTSGGSQLRAYQVTQTREIGAHDISWEIGAQYIHPLGKNRLTVGAVFSPRQQFSAGNSLTRYIYDTYTRPGTSQTASELIEETVTPYDGDLYFPMNIGAGVSYQKSDRLTLSGDVLYQNWENVPSLGYGTFKDRWRYAAGVEYIANPQGNYFRRIRFRMGAYYTDSYVDVKGSGMTEAGITAGFGLPFKVPGGRESLVNLGFEYLKITPENKALINEQYFRITLGISFSETWFRKYKFQ
ncbi:MAG: outer membrane protein transport protein [Bacteroidales bacterium]|jgi:hypothetical protein|nr:outer membrane protein transport protein [Bacteroidales bacterium]